MFKRSPSFQFYPDKWCSHVGRLSDSAYRVYHSIMCWMWQHSPNQYSISSDPEAIAVSLAMHLPIIEAAMAEIQNRHAPLLRLEDGRLISNGLRKERQKQNQWARISKAGGQASARSRKARYGSAQPKPGSRNPEPLLEPLSEPKLEPRPEPSPNSLSPSPSPSSSASLKGSAEDINPPMLTKGRGGLGGYSKRSKRDEPLPDLPETLRIGNLPDLWARWVLHKAGFPAPKRVHASGAMAQFKIFERWGIERACRALEHSLASQWEGIHEPKPEHGAAVAAHKPDINRADRPTEFMPATNQKPRPTEFPV